VLEDGGVEDGVELGVLEGVEDGVEDVRVESLDDVGVNDGGVLVDSPPNVIPRPLVTPDTIPPSRPPPFPSPPLFVESCRR